MIKFMFTLICLGVILVVAGLFLLTWKYLFEIVVFDGDSMYPTLKDGQLILIQKSFLRYDINNIYIYKSPDGLEVVKRLKNNREDDALFFEGDNKNFSRDSRHYGFVTENNIIGKVIYWRK